MSMGWIYEMLCDLDLAHHSGDSAVPGLNRDTAHSLKIVLPTDGLLQRFDELWTPLRKAHDHNVTEGGLLGELRDTLLGPLFSGDLTIKGAEEAAGAML
jgi:type I restriction enzyme S subunit